MHPGSFKELLEACSSVQSSICSWEELHRCRYRSATLGDPCCCFHSSLQNAMKWTIESRGAAFSSACFLERAVFSFCCWKTGKRGTTQKDSGHLLTVSESVKSTLSDIKAEDLHGGRTHLFSTPRQSFLPLWCTVIHPSLHPTIHLFMHIFRPFFGRVTKRTHLKVSGVSVTFQTSSRTTLVK